MDACNIYKFTKKISPKKEHLLIQIGAPDTGICKFGRLTERKTAVIQHPLLRLLFYRQLAQLHLEQQRRLPVALQLL